MMRRAVFLIHLVTGCIAGAVILFLALTGSILTYQRQIVAFQERGFRSTPTSGKTTRQSLDALLQLASTAKNESPSAVMIWSDREAPVEVEFGRGDRLLLDCYSGVVLGAGAVRTRSFFEAVTGLHRWFGAGPQQKPLARAVQGVFDLALLLMICTGLILWWPRKLSWTSIKAGAILRFGLRGRARDWNRHNVIGLWVALPLSIIVITGAILSYGWATNLLYRLSNSPLPASVRAEKAKKLGNKKHIGDEVAAISIDQIFNDAASRVSGWHSLRATLPKPGGKPITVTADSSDGSRPDGKTELVFDRDSDALLQLNTFSSNNLGTRLRLFVHMVHTGEAGGVLGQTVSGLASLGCCMLIWSGTMLVIRRARMAWTTSVASSRRERMAHLSEVLQMQENSSDNSQLVEETHTAV